MTYGVDQCRMCGAPITPRGPEQIEEWEKAQRKPPMTEKEWRAKGFLATPTRRQIGMPWLGCCAVCAMKQMHKTWKFNVRGAILMLGSVVIGAFVVALVAFLPH